jgi:hypothetical protein
MLEEQFNALVDEALRAVDMVHMAVFLLERTWILVQIILVDLMGYA